MAGALKTFFILAMLLVMSMPERGPRAQTAPTTVDQRLNSVAMQIVRLEDEIVQLDHRLSEERSRPLDSPVQRELSRQASARLQEARKDAAERLYASVSAFKTLKAERDEAAVAVPSAIPRETMTGPRTITPRSFDLPLAIAGLAFLAVMAGVISVYVVIRAKPAASVVEKPIGTLSPTVIFAAGSAFGMVCNGLLMAAWSLWGAERSVPSALVARPILLITPDMPASSAILLPQASPLSPASLAANLVRPESSPVAPSTVPAQAPALEVVGATTRSADGKWYGTYDCANRFGMTVELDIRDGKGISKSGEIGISASSSRVILSRSQLGSTATLEGNVKGDSIEAVGDERGGARHCTVKLSRRMP